MDELRGRDDVQMQPRRTQRVRNRRAQRSAGRFGLFFVERYAPEYCVEFASLTAGPRIEDFTPE